MMRWSGAMHFIGRAVTVEVEDRVKSNGTSQNPSPVSQEVLSSRFRTNLPGMIV